MEDYACISFKTKYGWLSLYATSKGLKEIRFGKAKNKNSSTQTSTLQLLRQVRKDILVYLEGKKVKFNYHLDATLTEFQTTLFDALIKHVSYGELISYKRLSSILKTSPRACGQALGANPLPIIIPCHRVIQENRSLGGFGGGLRWKRALIKLESKRV